MECNHTATGSLLWIGTVIAPMPLSSIGLVVNVLFVSVIFYGQYIGRLVFSVLVATWLVALLLSSVELTFLLSFFRFVSIVNCDTDDCIRILEILVAGTSAIIYISVVVLYVWTFHSVKESEKATPRSHSMRQSNGNVCPKHSAGICLYRLGANIVTYMFMCSMEAPGTWIAASLSPMYRENGNCIFNSTEQASQYHSTVIFSVICCTIFLLRIIVDPLVNCLVDRKLKTLVIEIFLRRKQPVLSRTDTAISTSVSVRDANRLEKSG